MCNVKNVEKLISEINRIHYDFSKDYFDVKNIEKLNLSKTINHIPVEYILKYRLNLHESINDYLMNADLNDVNYYYRVKTSESILDKINRFELNGDKYPVNNWLNDIFGARVVLSTSEIKQIEKLLDVWKERYNLKNWYKRDKNGYKGIHLYFKNKSNFYFPWELQIWDKKDVQSNIDNHIKYKRNFL